MDFESDGSRSFTFNESNFETPYCFQVTIIDDDFLEDTEMFSLVVNAGSDSDVNIKINQHRIQILDNESMFVIHFSSTSSYMCSFYISGHSWLQPVSLLR